MKPTRSDHVSDEALARRGLSRETDLRLDARGRWWSGTQPVAHPGVADAFSRWIERTDAGRYALRNDLHYVYVTVEGAPLHAEAVERGDDGAPVLRLRGGVREPLRAETLRQGADGVLYASARDGTWTVRLSAEAALDLAPWLVEGPALQVGERVTPIPTV